MRGGNVVTEPEVVRVMFFGTEDVVRKQEMQVTSRIWKRQKNKFSQSLQRNYGLPTLSVQ